MRASAGIIAAWPLHRKRPRATIKLMNPDAYLDTIIRRKRFPPGQRKRCEIVSPNLIYTGEIDSDLIRIGVDLADWHGPKPRWRLGRTRHEHGTGAYHYG